MANKAQKKKPSEDHEVFVYVGPSIRGVIQNGTIYYGPKESVFESLCDAIKKYPMISKLVVRDTEVAEAREKITNRNNLLSIAYSELSKA